MAHLKNPGNGISAVHSSSHYDFTWFGFGVAIGIGIDGKSPKMLRRDTLFPYLWQADSDKALLIVTNLSDHPESGSIKLNLGELDVPAGSPVEVLSHEGLSQDCNEFVLIAFYGCGRRFQCP